MDWLPNVIYNENLNAETYDWRDSDFADDPDLDAPVSEAFIDMVGFGPDELFGEEEEEKNFIEIVDKHLPGQHDQQSHAGGRGRDESAEILVGITSARPHKARAAIIAQMDRFRYELRKAGAKKVRVSEARGGGPRWGGEVSWGTSYNGNGKSFQKLAETAKKYNQDAFIYMKRSNKNDKQATPVVTLNLGTRISDKMRGSLEQGLLTTAGFGGWTWFKGRGGEAKLMLASIPDYGGDRIEHLKKVSDVKRILKRSYLKMTNNVEYRRTFAVERKQYDEIIANPHSVQRFA